MYRLFESVCVFLFRSSSALVSAHRAAIFRLRKVANGAKVLAINGATNYWHTSRYIQRTRQSQLIFYFLISIETRKPRPARKRITNFKEKNRQIQTRANTNFSVCVLWRRNTIQVHFFLSEPRNFEWEQTKNPTNDVCLQEAEIKTKHKQKTKLKSKRFKTQTNKKKAAEASTKKYINILLHCALRWASDVWTDCRHGIRCLI